ncbi:hypothetical protein [Winogradskya consettensis]|nr:hypothetical protein [Actinoplanes consettensis]
MLYGCEVDAAAEALHKLDPRYASQVPVRRYRDGAEVDAARDAAPDIAWLVVELYRPGVTVGPAREPFLALNVALVAPALAARAIDQPDLITWYEIINPVQTSTVDGRPPAHDYSNLTITVPEGHRTIAHAARTGEPAPACIPHDAERVLPSHDLWALASLRRVELCSTCALHHGPW